MGTLTGQRALVTGGSKGIGEAIVRRLAAQGASVIIAAQDMVSAERLANEVGGQALRMNVSELREVQRLVSGLGTLDILINNAGCDQHDFFTHTTVEQWQYLLAVNLQAVFATTHAALPGMQKAAYGRIINVGSEAGRQGSKGGAVYAAAKGGVIAFSKSIARENARFGITVNVVAPGPVDTPLLRKALDEGGERLMAAMKASTLVGRLGTTDEVAAAVAFLASREASFITGETLGVSGGMGC